MKQVLQNRRGSNVVRNVPAPPCPPGGVLVRTEFSVISSGTERSRVELSKKSLVGKALERPDLVREVVDRARRDGLRDTRQAVSTKLSLETATGYSSAGRVVEVGPAVRGLSPGDRVACCGGGHANHAEIVAIPRNLVARVPDGVPMEAAAFSTIAAIALHGVRLSGADLGSRAAVVGCGLVGQIACRLLSASGAEVFALDVDQTRVAAARTGGADYGFAAGPEAERQVLGATKGMGVDAVVVAAATSTADPLLLATKIARERGAVVLIGDVPIELPRAPLYEKELSFRVSRSYGAGRYDLDYEERGLDYPIGYVRWTEQRNMECVLELQARGKLSLLDLIDEIVPVDDAPRAYERLVGPVEERPRGALVISYADPAGAGTTPSEPEAAHVPVEGKVRVGLIGPGSFASRVVVPAVVTAGAELALVGGGSGPSAEAATRNLGFARVAPSEADVVADPNVDAVLICTRHGSHARLVGEVLAAGKHVFCEKPLALDADELHGVIRAARSASGTLMVGFNRRFAPLLRDLRRHLDGGDGPVTAHYRISAGHVEAGHWVHDLEQGGGRALGEGCHFVDSLRFLVGHDVIQVYAAGHGQPGAPLQARDNLAITLTFTDGSIGTIMYAAEGGARVPKERLEAFRQGRTGVLDDYRGLVLYGDSKPRRTSLRTQEKGHREELAAFIEGVRRGEAPVSLDEIENTSLATLAIVESLRTGQPVRL